MTYYNGCILLYLQPTTTLCSKIASMYFVLTYLLLVGDLYSSHHLPRPSFYNIICWHSHRLEDPSSPWPPLSPAANCVWVILSYSSKVEPIPRLAVRFIIRSPYLSPCTSSIMSPSTSISLLISPFLTLSNLVFLVLLSTSISVANNFPRSYASKLRPP
jgi:hypothetical protein